MTMRAIGSAIALWAAFHAPALLACAANEEESHALPPFRVVDLNVRERQSVRLSDETTVPVSLLEVNETRGDVRGAVNRDSSSFTCEISVAGTIGTPISTRSIRPSRSAPG